MKLHSSPIVASAKSDIVRRTQNGFSLVEVTIAIGVVGFAILVLVGTMTTSMGVLSDSRHKEIVSVISRSVSSFLLSSEFKDLPTAPQAMTFDSEGLPVSAGGVYSVEILPRDESNVKGLSLASSDGAVFGISVFHNPGHLPTSTLSPLHRSSVVVAN